MATTLVGAAIALLALPGVGRSQQVPEYQLKAVFLHRFGSFVEWPANAVDDSTFTIGVLGRDPFGEALGLIQSQTVHGRPVEIRRFPQLEDLEWTNILYVSESESDHLELVMRAVGDWATLTVGDADEFTKDGGIIRFVVREERIRLEVNRCAAERAGLRISGLLLRLADITSGACEEVGS